MDPIDTWQVVRGSILFKNQKYQYFQVSMLFTYLYVLGVTFQTSIFSSIKNIGTFQISEVSKHFKYQKDQHFSIISTFQVSVW